MRIEFQVCGRPMTQGSTRVIPLKAKGGGYQVRPDGRPKLIPVHDKGKELKAWRQQVALTAREVYNGPLLLDAVALTLVFERPRPKGHYGTGRNAGKLKASATDHPIQKPDVLKLARAVEDALSGVVWKDDSQVVEETLLKCWGDCYRVSVTIQPLPAASPPASGCSAPASGSTSACPAGERLALRGDGQSPAAPSSDPS